VESRIIKGLITFFNVHASDRVERINELINEMDQLEQHIADEFELLKKDYETARSSMSEAQNYLLAGIQISPTSKSYLLTNKGIEVLGEDVTPLMIFLDNVLRYANSPKRKIEVLSELNMHLEKISQMTSETSAST
jgi:hypothetical protein